MIRNVGAILSVASAISVVPAAAFAQSAPPTHKADPGVYQVVFENDSFRVISATWQPGQTDKAHSHSVASIAYALTDCNLKLTSADGKVVDVTAKAGSVNAVGMTPSHTTSNVGAAECRSILIEQK